MHVKRLAERLARYARTLASTLAFILLGNVELDILERVPVSHPLLTCIIGHDPRVIVACAPRGGRMVVGLLRYPAWHLFRRRLLRRILAGLEKCARLAPGVCTCDTGVEYPQERCRTRCVALDDRVCMVTPA